MKEKGEDCVWALGGGDIVWWASFSVCIILLVGRGGKQAWLLLSGRPSLFPYSTDRGSGDGLVPPTLFNRRKWREEELAVTFQALRGEISLSPTAVQKEGGGGMKIKTVLFFPRQTTTSAESGGRGRLLMS